MTWWLRAAEELRTLRQLGIAKPGLVVPGFLLEPPGATIEGTASEVRHLRGGSGTVADPPAGPALPPVERARSALPVARNAAAAKQPQSSFLRGGGRYKLLWEIRPQAGKTASK